MGGNGIRLLSTHVVMHHLAGHNNTFSTFHILRFPNIIIYLRMTERRNMKCEKKEEIIKEIIKLTAQNNLLSTLMLS